MNPLISKLLKCEEKNAPRDNRWKIYFYSNLSPERNSILFMYADFFKNANRMLITIRLYFALFITYQELFILESQVIHCWKRFVVFEFYKTHL